MDEEWLQKLVLAAKPHVPPVFTGQITINLHEGKIASVELREHFKAEKERA